MVGPDPIRADPLIRRDNFQVIIGTILLREQKATGSAMSSPLNFYTFFLFFFFLTSVHDQG